MIEKDKKEIDNREALDITNIESNPFEGASFSGDKFDNDFIVKITENGITYEVNPTPSNPGKLEINLANVKNKPTEDKANSFNPNLLPDMNETATDNGKSVELVTISKPDGSISFQLAS